MWRSAIRSLLRSPRLSLAAVLCVSLGAAATSSIATLVSAAVVQPLPFPSAERMVRVWFDDPGVNSRVSLSVPDVLDLSGLSCFDAVLGTARVRVVALLEGGAQRMRGEAVSPGYFQALGIQPARGRVFSADDDRADAARVVVLSHRTWVSRYGSRDDAIGEPFRTERAIYTIVGVAQPSFSGTVEDDVVEFWTPLAQIEPATDLTSRAERGSWAIGRLRNGTSADAAAGEVAALGRRLAQEHPDLYKRVRMRIEPMGENWRSGLRSGAWLLLAASLLLLGIAATNVAGLMTLRVIDRRHELAVRAALGAGHGHLARQLALETLLLVAAGGALGILVAPATLTAFLKLSPVELPSYLRLDPNGAVLAVSVAVLAIAGLAAALVPAAMGSRANPAEAIKEGGRGSMGSRSERRWGTWLACGEVALTVTLLVAGALLMRSWQRLRGVNLGYRSEGIARLALTVSRQDGRDAAAILALYERVRNTLQRYPGVEQVGLVAPTLPPWDAYRARIRYPGMDAAQAEDGREIGTHAADEGLLPMLGIPVLAGRNLQPSDGADSHVVLVSRSLANRMGGVHAALERELTIVGSPDSGQPAGTFRIVGVVENAAYDGLVEQDTRRFIHYGESTDAHALEEDIYLSLAEYPSRVFSIGVYTRGSAAALLDPLKRELGKVAPTSPVHWTGTMTDGLALEYAPSRFYAALVAAFSVTALVLTGVGVFAVFSHGVSRRTAEIGMRMVLGAMPRDVVRLVLGHGLAPSVTGVLLGLGASLLLTRLMQGVLYGVSTTDAAAFLSATAIVLAIALAAGLLPARQAMRVDLMRALRRD
jgi:putative ABC transport system permease protein